MKSAMGRGELNSFNLRAPFALYNVVYLYKNLYNLFLFLCNFTVNLPNVHILFKFRWYTLNIFKEKNSQDL